MPIEIRELVIKVTVQDQVAGAGAPATLPAPTAELRQWQQVLAELQRQRER